MMSQYKKSTKVTEEIKKELLKIYCKMFIPYYRRNRSVYLTLKSHVEKEITNADDSRILEAYNSIKQQKHLNDTAAKTEVSNQ